MLAQIRKEVTDKPVRYLVNSHFHWDHTQGDVTYKKANAKIEIIASDATKQLMMTLQRDRLKESLDSVPGLIDAVRSRLSRAKTAQEREWCNEQLRQLTAYQQEMKDYPLELPTVTFDKTHVIKDRSGELQLAFNGKAHTAGDIQVFSPSKKVVASGDAIIGIHGPIDSTADAEIGTSGAAISHGCIRLHDADLAQLSIIPAGTPLAIVN